MNSLFDAEDRSKIAKSFLPPGTKRSGSEIYLVFTVCVPHALTVCRE